MTPAGATAAWASAPPPLAYLNASSLRCPVGALWLHVLTVCAAGGAAFITPFAFLVSVDWGEARACCFQTLFPPCLLSP